MLRNSLYRSMEEEETVQNHKNNLFIKLSAENMFPPGIELLLLPIEIDHYTSKTFRDTSHYSITTSADSCFTIQFVVVLHLRVLTARSCGCSGMSCESNSTTLVYTLVRVISIVTCEKIGLLPWSVSIRYTHFTNCGI